MLHLFGQFVRKTRKRLHLNHLMAKWMRYLQLASGYQGVTPRFVVSALGSKSIVLVSLLALFLTSCGLARQILAVKIPDLGDGGFISDQPCAPPCFWGIVPGESHEDEVVDSLRQKEVLQACESFDNEDESGGRGIICRSFIVVSFAEKTEIVESIGFAPSKDISVSDAIDKYGEPDAVSVLPAGIPENRRTVMIIYFDDIRARIALPEQSGVVYKIEPFTEVENIGYSDIEVYQASKRFSQVWVGYSEYELDDRYK
jgi:hypothetical protein